MDKIIFKAIIRPNGRNEFEEFYESLPKKDREKLVSVIHNISDLGIQTSIKMQWVKKLGTNIYEIRSKVGSNIQRTLYFHYIDGIYYITHGFTKKTQRTPIKEINHALVIKNEFIKNKENRNES